MLERRVEGTVPDKPHTILRDERGTLMWEECFTRGGFDGAYSILYHRHRPHEARALAEPSHGFPPAVAGAPSGLLRRHFAAGSIDSGGPVLDARRPLLFNEDVVVSVLRPDESDRVYFANGDADELYFVHAGGGMLRTMFGDLEVRTGDYVWIPRGVQHRFDLDDTGQFWLLVECRGAVDVPRQYRNPAGQLRMDAPYSHRDFRAPRFVGPVEEDLREVVIQRGGRLYGFSSDRCPFDVVGWDGTVYPVAFSIFDFEPRVGRVHLPPTIFATFQAPGVLVCSFVPRPVDFDPQAIPCPYPHSSVDVDEVIFYSRGHFTSRRGIGPGSISHHPAGVPHGPHPGAYEESIGRERVDELAVMLDCARPLTRTPQAELVEDVAYHDSFVDRS